MMTVKHTPGQWIWGENFSGLYGAGPDNEVLCHQTYEGMWLNSGKRLEANAALIAAAPDLLEALEAAVACGLVPKSSANDGGAFRHSEQVRVADQIRAAIAKAKGETPSIQEQKPPLFQFKNVNDIRPGMLEAHHDCFKAVIYSSIGTIRAIVSYRSVGGEMGGLHGYFGSQEDAMEWCERKAAMIISERKGERV